MQAPTRTIDDVILGLDEIIAECHERGSRLGYFPAMYRKTTLEVKAGIEAGRFRDPVLMEQLDVVFADRYLDAYRLHRCGERPTAAWAYAFRMAESPRPTVIQHLLLGMNAHINLDLGISAVDVAGGASLSDLKHDFDEINDILGELVDRVQDDLTSMFPLLGALDFLCLRLDEVAVHLAVRVARAGAWDKAVALARAPGDRWTLIGAFDRETLALAEAICPRSHLPSHQPHDAGAEPCDEDAATVRSVIEALLD